MNTYNVKYFNGSSGVKSVKASSSSDARMMVESSGAIVYEISGGPEGTVKIMDYGTAVKMKNGR